MKMELETERLILRPWRDEDAENLYEYAKDPRVGPEAGWFAHTSVEYSLDAIRGVLSNSETYAIILKKEDKPVGGIDLMIGDKSYLDIGSDEGELGFWIAVPYWGRGLVGEAVDALLRHSFEDLNLKTIWCGYFEGNNKSKKVQEKCGFKFHHVEKDKFWPITKEIKTEYVNRMTKEEWKNSCK